MTSPAGAQSRRLALSGNWFSELCLWLQRPRSDVGPLAWPVLLLPDVAAPGHRAPEGALHVYERIEWHVPDVPEELELGMSPRWTSVKGDTSEIGLATTADSDGKRVADGLMVMRVPGALAPFGERELPRPPDTSGLQRTLSLVLDEYDVDAYARLSGASYPLHVDPSAAQRAGYPNVLVQGMVLLTTVLYFAGMGPRGTVEAWFRAPVPAGAALVAHSGEVDGAAIWELRMPGRGGEVALVARIVTDV